MKKEFEEQFVRLQEQYNAGLIRKKDIIRLEVAQAFLKGGEGFYEN